MHQWIRIDGAGSDPTAPQIPLRISFDVHAAVTKAVGRADVSLADIGLLIREDPVLSQLVLEHVNSAANALRNPVESVSQAVSLLGTVRMKEFLTTIENIGLDDRPPTQRPRAQRPPMQKFAHRSEREIAHDEG